MGWNKKVDDAKLSALFQQITYRGGLDCNRREKEYIEPTRVKYFPLIAFKHFQQIFKTKAVKVSFDNKLKGRRKSGGKSFSIYPFDLRRIYFSHILIDFSC